MTLPGKADMPLHYVLSIYGAVSVSGINWAIQNICAVSVRVICFPQAQCLIKEGGNYTVSFKELCAHSWNHLFISRDTGRMFKMVAQEDPELISSHEHIKSTDANGTIPSKKRPKN